MNKPCPFCKNTTGLYIRSVILHQVVCPECGADGPFKDTPEEAWAAWNTRPVEDALQAKLDAALEVCRGLVEIIAENVHIDVIGFKCITLELQARKVVEG